jgi:hypothetical protein
MEGVIMADDKQADLTSGEPSDSGAAAGLPEEPGKSTRPDGLARRILGFVLRHSLLWAAGAMFFGVLMFFLPAKWFGGDPWGSGHENVQAALLPMLIAMALSMVALARTGFSERDRERPFWLLALKAVGLFVLYIILAVGGSMLLLLIPAGESVMLLAVPVLLVLGLLAGRKGGSAKEISDRKTRWYAPVIIFLVVLIFVAIPSYLPSKMAGNESATIGWLRGFHNSQAGAVVTAGALDKAASGWLKHEDGSPAWFGFYFQVVDLPSFGGMCVVARPITYNRSGLNTFVLTPSGIIYQRDLGNEDVHDPARWDPMSPEQSWIVCE